MVWRQVQAAARGRHCCTKSATAPATADCHTLTAHNNDMSRRYQDDLVAFERTCGDDPTVLTIGNGVWISVGWNDAGLNLTGNELSPNDERVGVPRHHVDRIVSPSFVSDVAATQAWPSHIPHAAAKAA